MPNKDNTGPEGAGPMTGRGSGPCGDRNKAGGQQEEFERMIGTTDFAQNQYSPNFAIESDSGYPKRTDSTDQEYYGKRRRRGQQ